MTKEEIVKTEDSELKAYEIGFLLSPMVPEEGMTEVINEAIVNLIEKRGGKVQSRTAPEMKVLAYPVTHVVGNDRSKYKNAYFGALVFELSPAELEDLTGELKNSPKIIRFLTTIFKKEEKPAPRTDSAPKKEMKEKAKTPVSEEEIDKKLEDLLEVETV